MQQQEFLNNLAILRVKYSRSASHDIRIAIKKLRAYQKIHSLLFKKKLNITGFEKTEKLFSILGKLRDLEVGLSLLKILEKENEKNYTSLKKFLKAAGTQVKGWVAHAIETFGETEWGKITTDIEFDQNQHKEVKPIESIKEQIQLQLDKLVKLTIHFSENAHRVRKLLKDIYYWVTMNEKGEMLLNPGILKKIKKAMELLGNWQDHEMLLRKVKHFRKDFVPDAKQEYALLKMLEKNIENKMETILKNADKNIRCISL